MSLPPPPPQDDDPIITQFRPVEGQWELMDDNINHIDPKHGQSILHNYCRYINTTPLEVYRYLIEAKGCDVDVSNKYKNTPVHLAFCFFNANDGGNITVLLYLLTQTNINANTKGYNGETLLHYVCSYINRIPVEIFQYLIETHGCDINVQDNKKDTPIHRAITYFRSTEDGGNITALSYLLSQKGINGNDKNNRGCTLLHYACQKINKFPIDIFKLLIETQGCDVNAQNSDHDTPLYDALRYFNPPNGGDINVLGYLINQQDVNVNIKGKQGYNLLHLVCINNLSASVRLNARYDTMLCQVVEDIVERYTQQILDKVTF